MKLIVCPKGFTIPKVKDAGEDAEKVFTFTDFLRNVVSNYPPFRKWPESRKGDKLLTAIEGLEKSITSKTLTLEDDLHETLKAGIRVFEPPGALYVIHATRAGFYEAIETATDPVKEDSKKEKSKT